MRQQLPFTVQRNSRGMDEARQLFGQAISEPIGSFFVVVFLLFCFFTQSSHGSLDWPSEDRTVWPRR